MLVALTIRDIVVIDRLSISFGTGMTVFTGETGAGKSILLDALSLALGARGDASLVRAGAKQGEVAAVFDLAADHPVQALLDERGLAVGDQLILRRVQNADGRSRAFVNDEPVSVGLMRDIGVRLVEIHGQHDDRAMVDGARHRALLDAYGGLAKETTMVAEAFAEWRRRSQDLKELGERIAVARADREYLRAAVDELVELAPQPAEETHLVDARQRMMRVDRIASDIAEARDVVTGDASPIPILASLVRRLERTAEAADGVLDASVQALDAALSALQEAEAVLANAMAAVTIDPGELERSEERLFALRAASRKHAVPVSELADLTSRLAADLSALETGEERLKALEAETGRALDNYRTNAAALSAARRRAGELLATAVAAELPDLKLERASFNVEIATDTERVSEVGADAVAFVVQTNPGQRQGPLMKVASGGELSRFLLALKVALSDRGSAPTLVFDEVDTAVGGAVADAIGSRLARLADRVQVVSVTHAPQVAARAGAHLLVAKEAIERGTKVATSVAGLSGDSRREEIARMLAGATVTDEARAAADRLILGAA